MDPRPTKLERVRYREYCRARRVRWTFIIHSRRSDLFIPPPPPLPPSPSSRPSSAFPSCDLVALFVCIVSFRSRTRGVFVFGLAPHMLSYIIIYIIFDIRHKTPSPSSSFPRGSGVSEYLFVFLGRLVDLGRRGCGPGDGDHPAHKRSGVTWPTAMGASANFSLITPRSSTTAFDPFSNEILEWVVYAMFARTQRLRFPAA